MCFSCVKFNKICYFLGGNSFAKFSISQNWKRKNPNQYLKKNRIFMNQRQTLLLAKSNITRAVSHHGLAIYIKKYLKANLEELWKTQIFHHAKKYQSSKKSSKRNQNPPRYIITLIITNLKFQQKQKYHVSKILIE